MHPNSPSSSAMPAPPMAGARRWLTPSRMLVALALLMLLVVWLGVVLQLVHSRRETLEARQQQNVNLARVLQEQTERVIASADQSTLRLGQLLADGQLQRHDLVLLANETGLAPRILVQLSLVDANGVFRGSNIDPDGSKTGAVDLSEREHVRVHLTPQKVPEAAQRLPANGLFIGKPVLGKVSKRWTIQLSRLLRGPQGQTLGVAVASLDPGYFEDVYRRVALGQSGGVSLVGADLVLRARVLGGQPLGMGQTVGADSPLARPDPSGEGSYRAYSTLDGIERLITYRKIGGYPLYVVVSSSVDEALENWRSARMGLLLLAALLSLAVVAGIWAVLQSVRRIEQAHQALSVSEAQAQAANQAKTEFLTAISHELRTPLTSIRGFAELMERRLDNPRFREQAGLIRKGAEHLNSLLTDILDLTRVEAGAMPLIQEPADVVQLVRDSCEFFAVSAAEKGLVLEHHIDPAMPQRVLTDRLRVRQILNNLLANAIKFTPQGSVRVEVQREGDQWCCHVIDTGPGIALDRQELVFEKFRQGDGTVSTQHGGTGLGLALSRSLAQLMGGALVVSSELGHGSRFTLRLPLTTSP